MDNLTAYASAGYEGKASAHLSTSPAYYAHALGAYFRSSGRSTPTDVRMGRGYSIRANNMRFRISEGKGAESRVVTFERVE